MSGVDYADVTYKVLIASKFPSEPKGSSDQIGPQGQLHCFNAGIKSLSALFGAGFERRHVALVSSIGLGSASLPRILRLTGRLFPQATLFDQRRLGVLGGAQSGSGTYSRNVGLIERYTASKKADYYQSQSEFGNPRIFRELPFSNRHLSFFEGIIAALVFFFAFLFFCFLSFLFIGRAVDNCGFTFKRNVVIALMFAVIGQLCACSALIAL
jgi:hypothetical protein